MIVLVQLVRGSEQTQISEGQVFLRTKYSKQQRCSTDVHRRDSTSLVHQTGCCFWDSQPNWNIAFGNTSDAAFHLALPKIHTNWIRTAIRGPFKTFFLCFNLFVSALFKV